MVVTGRPRPLRRDHNGILFYLHMEDWPEDVPLLEGTKVLEIGTGAYWPYWNIILEPNRTVELVFGWFIVPLSVEETFKWYQSEMEKRGWVEIERAETLPTWAMLRYSYPESDLDAGTYVVISIWRNRYLNRTQPAIRRVTVHPWSPTDGKRMADRHELDEGTAEFVEKLKIDTLEIAQ